METISVEFYSHTLGRRVPYRIYMPENLASGKLLPVVYLLHGGGADYRSWSNDSNVAQYAGRNLILVMPDGDESYFMNEVGSPQNRFEDFVTQDLIANVEDKFPARRDRAGRAIVGVSMGGYGALTYAFKHPNLYVFVGALSAPLDVTYRHFSLKRMGQWWKFRNIFGPAGSKERSDRNPFDLMSKSEPRLTPYLYLTVGEQEALRESNERFAALLKAHGFAYEFHTKPGGHDWGEWNAQIPECFNALETHIRSKPN